MRLKLISLLMVLLAVGVNAQNWTASWTCAPQRTWQELPKGEDLCNHSVRQLVHLSVGGSKLKLMLTNEHSMEDLSIKSVYIANPGEEHSSIDKGSAKYLTFSGSKSVTIPLGERVWSDELEFEVKPLQRLSITISYDAKVPHEPTIHSGSRTHSYIIEGEADPNTDFSGSYSEVHWYSIGGIDVYTEGKPEVIACLGNSITDGRGVDTDADNRWTDVLAESFNGEVAVLNLGIGGNCVVSGGLGPTAKERFDTDILAKTGVTRVILFEGINDIGSRKSTPETADQLIKAYRRFIKKSHNAGLKIYGCTITPVKGSDYYTEEHEAIRTRVNEWILTCGEFDGVMDLASVVANPEDKEEILPSFQSDPIHPNPAGYKALGEYIANYFKKELAK